MATRVEMGMPESRALRIAFGILLVLVSLGLVMRISGRTDESQQSSEKKLEGTLSVGPPLIVPRISLDVSAGSKESRWTTALAQSIGGQAEKTVELGRVDVVTSHYAIEVDFLAKWKEGMGQALYYAEATDLTPVLAVIIETEPDESVLATIDKTSTAKGVKLILLVCSES